jgi:glutamine amidotransferase
MIAIIDYGMGNLGSVKRKLDKVGASSVITSDAEVIRKSDKIILPGVGHFAKAVSEIKIRGLWALLSEQVLLEKRPILGICLGMQLMAKYSEEGNSAGFGWFDANIVRFNVSDSIKYKVPHTGWNTIMQVKDSLLFEGINSDSEFCFVHSYHIHCNDKEDIVAETIYDYVFASAIQKNNLFGVQFHPEKSHDVGEMMLRNFVEL